MKICFFQWRLSLSSIRRGAGLPGGGAAGRWGGRVVMRRSGRSRPVPPVRCRRERAAGRAAGLVQGPHCAAQAALSPMRCPRAAGPSGVKAVRWPGGRAAERAQRLLCAALAAPPPLRRPRCAAPWRWGVRASGRPGAGVAGGRRPRCAVGRRLRGAGRPVAGAIGRGHGRGARRAQRSSCAALAAPPPLFRPRAARRLLRCTRCTVPTAQPPGNGEAGRQAG